MAEFEVSQSRNDNFYFVLQADNGKVVATSELHPRKQSCLEGIEVVKRIAATATVDDTTG